LLKWKHLLNLVNFLTNTLMFMNLKKLVNEIKKEPWAKGIPVEKDFWLLVMEWIDKHVLPEFLDNVIGKVDEIIEINVELSEQQILEKASEYIVDLLGALSASVRIYDPQTEHILYYGSFPSEEKTYEASVPLEGSITGYVLKSRQPYLVPGIMEKGRYRNKETINRKGVNSLMAIPLEIPRFFPSERDAIGVMQINFAKKKRAFTPLEIQIANLLAKRLSFVIVRKRILSMHKTNKKKESIVQHVYHKVGTRGGIRMKEVFNRVIPELADMVNIQSCALFSVTEDNNVVLEAGYPDEAGYHSIGKSFPVSSEPTYEVLLSQSDYSWKSAYDRVTPSYILVVDPQRSGLISENVRKFCSLNNINSILYIPLDVGGEITYFMTFDALDQRRRYSEDEIDIFMFLSRELMKARRMERLDDALHDFKSPAIATAGFARRLKNLLDKEEMGKSGEQIRRYVNIILEETSRLHELALGIYQVGREQVINLTYMLQRRFEINKEVMGEQFKQNVTLKEGPFDLELNVRCYPIHLERVFDNLLNNAIKAIPFNGGLLKISTYAEGKWACAEITNTGHISEEARLRILEGEGKGRGIYITNRIIRLLRGKMEIKGIKDTTTFVVSLPIYEGSNEH